MVTKKCLICLKEKTITEFYADSSRKDKHAPYCKDCIKNDPVQKERRKINNKKWRLSHPEKVRELDRRYKSNNRKKLSQKTIEWQRRNPEKANEKSKRYCARHPDLVNERHRIYAKKHPEERLIRTRNGHAKRCSVDGKMTLAEWHELLEEANYRCLCCGSTEKLTIDHIIPLSLGGPNEKENAQVLCLHCNQKKWTKIIDYRKKVT